MREDIVLIVLSNLIVYIFYVVHCSLHVGILLFFAFYIFNLNCFIIKSAFVNNIDSILRK